MIVPPEGIAVVVNLVDPWDFITENGPFRTGRIIGLIEGPVPGKTGIKIALDEPVTYRSLSAHDIHGWLLWFMVGYDTPRRGRRLETGNLISLLEACEPYLE